MVENSSLERKVILSHVKSLRIEYLIKHTILSCEGAFIPQQNILNNFQKMSQLFGGKFSEEIGRKLSKNDIKFGAEMFMALNACPSFYAKLYWKAIYGNESRMARFASNIIRKAKKGFKVSAQKIFSKISSVIGFKYISYHHEGNRNIAMNIDLSKNMLDVEGVYY